MCSHLIENIQTNAYVYILGVRTHTHCAGPNRNQLAASMVLVAHRTHAQTATTLQANERTLLRLVCHLFTYSFVFGHRTYVHCICFAFFIVLYFSLCVHSAIGMKRSLFSRKGKKKYSLINCIHTNTLAKHSFIFLFILWLVRMTSLSKTIMLKMR